MTPRSARCSFAVGTGRVAFPVARRGVEVAGVELSAAMDAAWRLRPGGCFAVEQTVPDVCRGEPFRVFHHGDQHHGIDEYELATQAMWSHHYRRHARRREP